MKKLFFFFLLILFISNGAAQSYNIGLRAGATISKLRGPTEDENEKYKFASGFHFALNFQWNFNTYLGVRGELLYQQIGSKYSYDGQGFYKYFVQGDSISSLTIRDRSVITLDISNAYFELPITIHLKIKEKVDIFAGGYAGVLLSPVASGTFEFGTTPGSSEHPEHAFIQDLIYNYSNDLPFDRDPRFFRNLRTRTIDNIDYSLPTITGAYYLYDLDSTPKKYKSLDFGLVGGISYSLNKGLYLSGRIEYGLVDITNDEYDASVKNLNLDDTLRFNNDNDRNLNISISLGFTF